MFAKPFDIDLRGGRVSGYFTVAPHGYCFQHDDGRYPVVPGTYSVGIGCHACSAGARFRVTR